MDEFMQALTSGSIVTIVGLALMAIAPLLGPELTERLASRPRKIVSLVRALFIGIGVPLAGATAFDLPWWIALLGALYMAVQSDGLRRSIWGLIPGKKPAASGFTAREFLMSLGAASGLLIALLIIVSLLSCSVQRAQVGTQTGLAAGAVTLDATDSAMKSIGRRHVSEVVERLQEPAPELASTLAAPDSVDDVMIGIVEFSRFIERFIELIRRALGAEDVSELQRVGDILTLEITRARQMLDDAEGRVPPGRLEELRQELEGWYNAVRAVEISIASLRMLQAAAETWYSTGDIPDNWDPLCEALRDDVESLVGLLEMIGVELPGGLESAGAFTEGICGYVTSLGD